MFSTSGGVQYIGGILWVYRGDIMSTSGVFSTSEGYHEYIEGCSVHRRDTMSTSGISWVHRGMFSTSGDIMILMWGHIMINVGDTMSTSGDVQYIGGYHEYIGGISWVHRGISWVHRGDIMSTSGGYHEYIGGCSVPEFSIEIERILSSCSPTCIMIPSDVLNIPRCTSGYPPDVLMVTLRCTEHPPMYSWYPPHSSWYPPDVLNIPRCTHDIPPMYSWYPPDVLNTPRCTEYPPMYWTHIIQGDSDRTMRIDCLSFQYVKQYMFKVTPTTFWLKCKNLPKCTTFFPTSKMLLKTSVFWQKIVSCIGKYGGLKAAYQTIFVLYAWIFELKFCL